jgi:mutator protein MutT
MPLVEVAAALIRDENGRYLIAQRTAGAPHAGLWEFPGGKRHPDESLEECLRRELAEELGASFRVGERVEVVMWPETDATIALSFYRCLHEHGAIEARAAQAVEWVEPARLDEYDFPPADRALIDRLRAAG